MVTKRETTKPEAPPEFLKATQNFIAAPRLDEPGKWLVDEVDGTWSTKMSISPAQAQRFIDTMSRNRKLDWKRVRELTEVRHAGLFRWNGDPVRINAEGSMFDGQHRMGMVIESNESSMFTIIVGMDEERVMPTVDVDRRLRSLPQIMQISGEESEFPVSILDTAVTALMSVQHDNLTVRRHRLFPVSKRNRFRIENRELIEEAASCVPRMKANQRRLAPPQAILAAWAILALKYPGNQELATEYLRTLFITDPSEYPAASFHKVRAYVEWARERYRFQSTSQASDLVIWTLLSGYRCWLAERFGEEIPVGWDPRIMVLDADRMRSLARTVQRDYKRIVNSNS